MDFLELAKKRFSARAFLDKSIGKDVLNTILEAGRVAPTGKNIQPHRILVVSEKLNKQKVEECAGQFYNADIYLIVCTDTNECWKSSSDERSTKDIDAAIVTDHMMLCAESLGINSIWLCRFSADKLRAEFNIPQHYAINQILALGYVTPEYKGDNSKSDRHAHLRKPLSHNVFFEKF